MFKFIACASIAIASQLGHVAAMEGDGLGETGNRRNPADTSEILLNGRRVRGLNIAIVDEPYSADMPFSIIDGRNDDAKKNGEVLSAPTIVSVSIPRSFGDQNLYNA